MAKQSNAKAYRLALGILRRRGLPLSGGWTSFAPMLEAIAKIEPVAGESARSRSKRALRALEGVVKPAGKPRKPKLKADKTKGFYESYHWRRLRMEILKRDGRRCACCGATPADGATMHIDHIKPLRLYWELRLDPNNLQVLCDVCNHGKGNWDQTDWREPRLSVLMGEKVGE